MLFKVFLFSYQFSLIFFPVHYWFYSERYWEPLDIVSWVLSLTQPIWFIFIKILVRSDPFQPAHMCGSKEEGRKSVLLLFSVCVQYPLGVLWSPFLFGAATVRRSNACIIAQTMSNCFSFCIYHFSAAFFVFLFRCLLVDCSPHSPRFPLLVFEFFTLFAYILHSLFRGGRVVSVYLLCKEASKRSRSSPFFRQYESERGRVCHFPSKLVYKGRQTQCRLSFSPAFTRFSPVFHALFEPNWKCILKQTPQPATRPRARNYFIYAKFIYVYCLARHLEEGLHAREILLFVFKYI